MKYLPGIFLVVLAVLPGWGEVLKLWSGREYTFPNSCAWQLVLSHGRVLAKGEGKIKLFIPELRSNSTLNATLNAGKKSQRVRFYSPEIFSGVTAGRFALTSIQKKTLEAHGVTFNDAPEHKVVFAGKFRNDLPGRVVVIFTEKSDFPLDLGNCWTDLSFAALKSSGCLGVSYDALDKSLNTQGVFSCAKFKNKEKCVIVLTPDFDLDNAGNLLWLKEQIAQNNSALAAFAAVE